MSLLCKFCKYRYTKRKSSVRRVNVRHCYVDYLFAKRFRTVMLISSPSLAVRSFVISVSVCLSASLFVCLSVHWSVRLHINKVSKVIWQKSALLFCHLCPSKSVPCHGGSGPHLLYGTMDRHESASERHLDRFSHFYTAYPCDKHTDRQADTQTTLRAASIAIRRIRSLMASDAA